MNRPSLPPIEQNADIREGRCCRAYSAGRITLNDRGCFSHAVAFALALCASFVLVGCATTIYPPPNVIVPAKVAVLDHGRHSSLVVEMPGKPAMIRYSYGDWAWYALQQTGVIETTNAIFWPSQGALGRRELPGPTSQDAVFHEVHVSIKDAIFIEVEASAVRDLIERLDGIYAANIATRIYNEAYDLEFVHHPDEYWALHNSNQMVGEWLVMLACRLEGITLFANWQLGDAAGEG